MRYRTLSLLLLTSIILVFVLVRCKRKTSRSPSGYDPTIVGELVVNPDRNPGGEAVEQHTLDDVLGIARELLANLQNNIRDYRAVLVKRERIGGYLRAEARMQLKIRNPQMKNGIQSGLSAYLKFLSPKSSEGREVIWQDGMNDNKLISHESGFKRNLGRMKLTPNGRLAMFGQKYPVTEIGLIRLVEKLIEKGERDQHLSDATVSLIEDQRVGDRVCRLIQVTHPQRKEGLDFHIAQIFIDSQHNVPIRYAAFLWPDAENDAPPLEEEYTFLELELNVGLTDQDFDPNNPTYDFP